MFELAVKQLRGIFADIAEAYLVGGSVRDHLLGVQPKDYDIVARCSREQLLALGAKPISTVSAFPVFHIHVDPLGTVEVALPRTETKTGYGYTGFSTDAGTHITIEEDLRRRDFTINSMAVRIRDGRLIDPFGGRNDLNTRTLKHTSDAFTEDPARVFRLLTFCSRDFNPHPHTVSFIREHDWKSDIDALPPERVHKEMAKAMANAHPERFFSELVNIGIGETFFPEVFRMPHVPAGPIAYHPEGDLLAHSLQTLARAAILTADPTARLCAFFHDIGKLATPPEKWPSHHDHDKQGIALATTALKRLKAPNDQVHAAASVNELHMKARTWPTMRPSSRVKLCMAATRKQVAGILPTVVMADSGIPMTSWEKVLTVANMNTEQLGVPLEWLHEHSKQPSDIHSMLMGRKLSLIEGLPFS